LAVTTVLLSSLAALVIVELVARATGHQPRRPADRPEPPIHAPDPVLGWKPLPGHYRFGPYSAGAAAVDVTIQPDGSRKTEAASSAGRPEVVLVGCSFTMGWAVSDDQTWAWRLQELRPDVEVVNRGVGGYGTLQSLLVLEQLIGREGQRPARVLYGFIDHGWRNVAAPIWLLALSFNQHTIATPYATLTADGRLERHPPLAYPSLPLHQYLASVALLEDAWLRWHAEGRQKMSGKVTQGLLKQMADLCHANGIGFSMVLLSVPKGTKAAYERFAKQEKIDVIDCNRQLSKDDVVPGEAHPNAAVHRAWGECIAAALAEPQRLGENR
jgi:hypothetical protein